MLVLMSTQFSLVKATKHKHKHKKNELVRFSCVYAYVDPEFHLLTHVLVLMLVLMLMAMR